MRRLLIAAGVVAVLVVVSLIPYYLAEQDRRRAIEFVRHYNGLDRKGASIADFISLTDIGCGCGSAGQVLQSWQAESGDQPNVWRVTCRLKTPLRTTELVFYTDMIAVWAGDEESEMIIAQVNS